ncbi:DUF2341 domain-containing protein [Chitinispirillales bacterium ANBcel5]|uniref:DUF2341 domain-containing protein n=1 Tax=Cellulosispirillum alkaliphilum TaxID=3039283 RepID=UPI002A52352A|nr:DUF2341 domain-containing protein [Chitinispirillales bacterium ANBcel5]
MRITVLLVGVLLPLLSCSPGDIAGSGGGSQTTNGVTASVLNTDGTPAAGSIVRLRGAEYVSVPGDHGGKPAGNLDTFTDEYGRFFITDIDSGGHVIEVQSSSAANGGGVLMFDFSVDEINDTIDLGTDSLHPAASVIGHVDRSLYSGQELYVQVRGLERITKVDSNGYFSFHDLPSGNLDIKVIESSTFNTVKEIANIVTEPQDTFSVMIPKHSTYSAVLSIDLSGVYIPASATITNFPMLVRLDSSSFDFSSAHYRGDDIRFSNLNGTSLPYEIEEWNSGSGTAAIWVSIDTLYGGMSRHTVVMSWGDTDAIGESNGAAVFDTEAGFAGVWHLNENPGLGPDAIKDRTVNGFHGTAAASMTEENRVEGIAGSALSFNGISDSIVTGLLSLDSSYTLSCWIKAEQGPSLNWRLIIMEPAYTLWYDTEWGGIRAEHFVDDFAWRGIYQDNSDSTPTSLDMNAWYHIAVTYDQDKIRLYVNGQIVDSTETIGMDPIHSGNPLLFGGRVYGGHTNEFFKGIMDEIRVETVARSPEWIRLSYKSQKPGSGVVRLGR